MKCSIKPEKAEKEWNTKKEVKNKGNKWKSYKYYSNYINNYFKCEWSKYTS